MHPIEALSNEKCRAITITRTLGAPSPWKVRLSGPNVDTIYRASFLWDALESAGCVGQGRRCHMRSDRARLAILAELPKIGHVELIVNGHMATDQTPYDYLCDAQKEISVAELAIGSTYLSVPLWRLGADNIVQLHCGNGLNAIGASVVQVLGIAEDYMADLTAPVEPDPRAVLKRKNAASILREATRSWPGIVKAADNSLHIIGQMHEYNDAAKLQGQLRDATRLSLVELQNKRLSEHLDMALEEIKNRDGIISKLEDDLKKG